MQRLFVMTLAMGLLPNIGLAQEPEQPAAKPGEGLKTVEQRASYAIGLNIGRDFQANGIALDPDLIAAGIKDGLTKANPKLTEEEINAAIVAFQNQMLLNRMPAEMKAKAQDNQKKGDDYLAKNKARQGVTTTDSGLQYEVVKAGKGTKPKESDVVKVHYHGTLIDGTVFDSSVERKEPAVFPVGGVIPGWIEALQLMPVGSKWKIYIPSDLAYGIRGSGGKIGPNETLVFEVELLEIVPEEN